MAPTILRMIGPEDLAMKPFRLRCLTDGCWLAQEPISSDYPDALNGAGEQHAYVNKHTVVIEEMP